jgi:hypothetical protein
MALFDELDRAAPEFNRFLTRREPGGRDAGYA